MKMKLQTRPVFWTMTKEHLPGAMQLWPMRAIRAQQVTRNSAIKPFCASLWWKMRRRNLTISWRSTTTQHQRIVAAQEGIGKLAREEVGRLRWAFGVGKRSFLTNGTIRLPRNIRHPLIQTISKRAALHPNKRILLVTMRKIKKGKSVLKSERKTWLGTSSNKNQINGAYSTKISCGVWSKTSWIGTCPCSRRSVRRKRPQGIQICASTSENSRVSSSRTMSIGILR